MTNEELDQARAARAWSDHYKGDGRDATVIAARLAREGWTPPVAVDPDTFEARAIVNQKIYKKVEAMALDAIKRGRALAAEAKPGVVWKVHDGSKDSPIYGDAFVWIKGKRNGQIWTDGEVWVERAKYVFWPYITHYAIITPPAEDVA